RDWSSDVCSSDLLDDERPVVAELLLEPRVRVVPIGAVLLEREAVLEGGVGEDAGKTQARHAVHLGRHEETVPVDGGVFPELISHTNDRLLTLAEPKERTGYGTVDGDGIRAPPGDGEW